ncbi:hypothetical protein AOLI_G00229480, partial [Acnodon oligacanthus]
LYRRHLTGALSPRFRELRGSCRPASVLLYECVSSQPACMGRDSLCTLSINCFIFLGSRSESPVDNHCQHRCCLSLFLPPHYQPWTTEHNAEFMLTFVCYAGELNRLYKHVCYIKQAMFRYFTV